MNGSAAIRAGTSDHLSILDYRLLEAIRRGTVYRTETNVDMNRSRSARGHARVSMVKFGPARLDLAEFVEETRAYKLTTRGDDVLDAWLADRAQVLS